MADHVSRSMVWKSSESQRNGIQGKTNERDQSDEYKESKNRRVIDENSKSKGIRKNAVDQCKELKSVINKISYVLSFFFCHKLV